jgi:uncharacterized protein (DUF1697 family)
MNISIALKPRDINKTIKSLMTDTFFRLIFDNEVIVDSTPYYFDIDGHKNFLSVNVIQKRMPSDIVNHIEGSVSMIDSIINKGYSIYVPVFKNAMLVSIITIKKEGKVITGTISDI